MSLSAARVPRRLDLAPSIQLDPGLVAVRGREVRPLTRERSDNVQRTQQSAIRTTGAPAERHTARSAQRGGAARRSLSDGYTEPQGGAAQKVAEKLIAAGLVREVKAKAGTPIWRRDEEAAQSFALKLTAAGLKAIAVDDGTADEGVVEPVQRSSQTRRNVAPKHSNKDDVRGGDRGQPAGPASAPRSGSKAAAIVDLLQRARGATIEELMAATGWLTHTTRAALTGLKKRGFEVTRTRAEGVTRYTIAPRKRAGNDERAAPRDVQAA